MKADRIAVSTVVASRPLTPEQVAPKYELRHERLLEVLHYDPGTGIFRWRARTGTRGNRTGKVAGTKAGGGYVLIELEGGKHFAHRLAFFYMTGRWPTAQIDHIDGDRANNRWGNLREATLSQNRVNRPRSREHLPRGVQKRGNSFGARLQIEGRTIWLGSFATQEEAEAAYLKAASEAFGDFLTDRALKVAEHD